MPISLTKDIFIKKSKSIHKDEYDYSKVVYVNTTIKVLISCSTHGDFYQLPKYHLTGSRCPKCAKKQYNTDEFIHRSKLIHNDDYDYKISKYINSKTKINFTCNNCDSMITMLPNNHLNGQGCKKCKLSTAIKYDKDKFISKSIDTHGDEYDYSKVNYIDSKTKVEIVCKKHGSFFQEASSHIRGHGCKKCRNQKFKTLYTKKTIDFIEDSLNIHDDLYDYSSVEYINSTYNVKIICDKHGEFEQLPHNHLRGSGCPICSKSKGEKKLYDVLSMLKIDFKEQYSFDGCLSKNGNKLKFDFYLPDYNLCIEYDGRQHFESIKIWGGDISFNKQKEMDEIKNRFCEKNNIKLIRIPYWDYSYINEIINLKLVI